MSVMMKRGVVMGEVGQCLYNIVVIMLNLFGHHKLIEGDYNLKDIRVMQEIGRGNSHVYKVMLKDNIFALKQIEVKTDYQYQNFHNEISYMRDLSQTSSFMIKYIGYFVTMLEINQYSKRRYAHIIMECAEMNLQHLIAYRYSQGFRFTKQQILNISTFLLEAFVDLQKNKIAHCDIKPQNILVVNSQTLAMKLCDVGSCKVVSSEQIQQATIFGTVPFLAPELLNKKTKKIISSNPFKSDVFSLGLVLLYLITNKKFSSKERIQISEGAYYEVTQQWIKQARQLTNYDSRISQVLKHCLEFQQFKRPLFTGVFSVFQAEKKKKKISHENKLKKLEMEEQEKRTKIEQNFTSVVPNNKISLFKSRNLTTKISNRTTSYGFPKINAKNLSRGVSPTPNSNSISPTISPLSKRQSSCFSSSPERVNSSVIDFKKIIYITEEEKDFIPYEYLPQQEKNFVLFTSYVGFKKADCVSIFPSCSLQAIYELGEVEANKLYLEYKGVQGIGVAEDVPVLNIKKIYANLSNTSLIGGYKYLFRSFCGDELESLDVKINGSDVVFNEVSQLLDLLGSCKLLKTFSLTWQSVIMTPEQHFQFNQKVSKLSVRKLITVMNQNFIKYEKQSRWLLPKNCETLYLEFQNNFLGKIITNLALSITKNPIKELYLNISNNNITKSQANFIFKSVASIETLEKLVLNLSWNPIDDLSYMLTEFQKLKNVTLLELKLFHCSIGEDKIIQAISELKYLFDNKMKILKVGYDRNMRKKQFQQKIEVNLDPFKNLKIDVFGNDNKYFMAFIKKKDKTTKAKGAVATNRIKGEKPSLGYKSITPDEKIPKSQNKTGFCQAFICNNQNFQNYVCLACSDFSELSKTQYLCKFCIENCRHKGHNFVKIYEKKRCNCAYSGFCTTQVSRRLCAQQLNIIIKQQYECLRCSKLLCGGCSTRCLQLHKDWVQISKEPLYFKCGTKI